MLLPHNRKKPASLPITLALCTLLLSAQGCGFTPVYQQNPQADASKQESNSTINELAAINVSPIQFGRAGQELQTQLQDLLNPSSLNIPAQYALKITLTKQREAMAIEQNREITRYNLVTKATYRLVDSQTGEVKHKGNSRIVGSYNAVESDFATHTVEQDTLSRIMTEMARDIRFKLSAAIAKNNAPK